MVEQAWLSFSFSDSNGMIRFKKKLQGLKAIIRQWVKEKKLQQSKVKNSLKKDLQDIDKGLDCGISSDSILLKRLELLRQLHDINHMEAKESAQRSKIKWAIEGVDGNWVTNPTLVKDSFKSHFEARFNHPSTTRFKLSGPFHNRLSSAQMEDLDYAVSRDEI
ncbi:hypothetical protein Tco_1119328, partial [Tanacetum coccineum]